MLEIEPARFAARASGEEFVDGILEAGDERLGEEFASESRRRLTEAAAQHPLPTLPAAETSVAVVFARSAKEARWQSGGGSLLELAEARGLTPEFSCRGGSCGTCKTRILAGTCRRQRGGSGTRLVTRG